MPGYPCDPCCPTGVAVECDLCQGGLAPPWVCVTLPAITDGTQTCTDFTQGVFQLEFDTSGTTVPFSQGFGCDEADEGPISWCVWRCNIPVLSSLRVFGGENVCLVLYVYRCKPDDPEYIAELRLVEDDPITTPAVDDCDLLTYAANHNIIWSKSYGATPPNCRAWSGEILALQTDDMDACSATTSAFVTAAGSGFPVRGCCFPPETLGITACCFAGSIPDEITVTIEGVGDCAAKDANCPCDANECDDVNGTYVLTQGAMPADQTFVTGYSCIWTVPLSPTICDWNRLTLFACPPGAGGGVPPTNFALLYFSHPTDGAKAAYIVLPAACMANGEGNCDWNACVNELEFDSLFGLCTDVGPTAVNDNFTPHACCSADGTIVVNGNDAIRVTVTASAVPTCAEQV